MPIVKLLAPYFLSLPTSFFLSPTVSNFPIALLCFVLLFEPCPMFCTSSILFTYDIVSLCIRQGLLLGTTLVLSYFQLKFWFPIEKNLSNVFNKIMCHEYIILKININMIVNFDLIFIDKLIVYFLKNNDMYIKKIVDHIIYNFLKNKLRRTKYIRVLCNILCLFV